MPRIDNSQPTTFDIPGVRFTPVASPSRGTSETSIWRARIVPGEEAVLHHMTREEIFVVTDGEGSVRIDGQAETLRLGDAFAVPAFTQFQLECANDQPFEVIVVLPVGGRADRHRAGLCSAVERLIPQEWDLSQEQQRLARADRHANRPSSSASHPLRSGPA